MLVKATVTLPFGLCAALPQELASMSIKTNDMIEKIVINFLIFSLPFASTG
jgi:hypothetical protein